MNKQLTLAIQLNDEASFQNFCWTDSNLLLKEEIQRLLNGHGERIFYIWGATGSGKSHLLQACCHSLQTEHSAIYLPLHSIHHLGPELLEGMDIQDLICIDDLDAIAGQKSWEIALFHLYNLIRDREQSALILSSQYPPNQIPLILADLRSRLSWGFVSQLHELSELDKAHALQLQAKKRGIELHPQVIQFMLNHCARNMHDLHQLLERLDTASLSAQRKITIPFVKSILGL